ncbi:MAG TPA: MTAP family purine nucleoside phosphorylase [Nitrososphaerales archaeon]|nr:MTAP family purine nucleoside phosphorylase [Nitrososphaerales archaeon]
MTRKTSPAVGVITGTGVTEHFDLAEKLAVRTRFGTAAVYPARDGSYYLIPRHGVGHGTPPHMVNYRANVAALRQLGVGRIIATSAVGSMNPKLRVGKIGLVSQFIDFTSRRDETFFDTEARHTDMTNPYSPYVNGALLKAGKGLRVRLRTGLVYVCVEGPRFETAAEIEMFRRLGGDVVGMTGVPEVVLANEAGIEYASVVVATNWAAGIQKKVSHNEVLEVMRRAGPEVKSLIVGGIRLLGGGIGRHDQDQEP